MTNYIHNFVETPGDDLNIRYTSVYATFLNILKEKKLIDLRRDEFSYSNRRCLIRHVYNISYVAEFPGNCSWLVWYNLSPIDIKNTSLIVDELALFLEYYTVFASHTNFASINALEERGYYKVSNNLNYHSGKTVYLLRKDFPKCKAEVL